VTVSLFYLALDGERDACAALIYKMSHDVSARKRVHAHALQASLAHSRCCDKAPV